MKASSGITRLSCVNRLMIPFSFSAFVVSVGSSSRTKTTFFVYLFAVGCSVWFVTLFLIHYVVLLSAGLETVPTGSPVMMSAAQCVMLGRSAARAERTETQKETKTLAKPEYSVRFSFPSVCGC